MAERAPSPSSSPVYPLRWPASPSPPRNYKDFFFNQDNDYDSDEPFDDTFEEIILLKYARKPKNIYLALSEREINLDGRLSPEVHHDFLICKCNGETMKKRMMWDSRHRHGCECTTFYFWKFLSCNKCGFVDAIENQKHFDECMDCKRLSEDPLDRERARKLRVEYWMANGKDDFRIPMVRCRCIEGCNYCIEHFPITFGRCNKCGKNPTIKPWRTEAKDIRNASMLNDIYTCIGEKDGIKVFTTHKQRLYRGTQLECERCFIRDGGDTDLNCLRCGCKGAYPKYNTLCLPCNEMEPGEQ